MLLKQTPNRKRALKWAPTAGLISDTFCDKSAAGPPKNSLSGAIPLLSWLSQPSQAGSGVILSKPLALNRSMEIRFRILSLPLRAPTNGGSQLTIFWGPLRIPATLLANVFGRTLAARLGRKSKFFATSAGQREQCLPDSSDPPTIQKDFILTHICQRQNNEAIFLLPPSCSKIASSSRLRCALYQFFQILSAAWWQQQQSLLQAPPDSVISYHFYPAVRNHENGESQFRNRQPLRLLLRQFGLYASAPFVGISYLYSYLLPLLSVGVSICSNCRGAWRPAQSHVDEQPYRI